MRDRFINALTIVGGTPGAPGAPGDSRGRSALDLDDGEPGAVGAFGAPSRGSPLPRPYAAPRGGRIASPLRRRTARRDWPPPGRPATPRSGAWP